ncbi:MAG TPA: rhomboid family intramembrane serine protease [Spirochaetota bacterium]|nr:rhomboid family intramembrane serine protease [Spirochaetota bacterium]HPJ35547.1 rhomboid family intramembrane serine protease [Spirochaetota bacterium]
MRRNGFSGSQNWVMRLIFINVAVFLIQIIVREYNGIMVGYFGLTPVLVLEKFFIWQIFTYMFLHGGFFHIFLNLYALMLFGIPVEQLWGSRKFLLYYFFTGVGAGISILVINTFLGGILYVTPTIGASGAVFGLLLAFGMLFPDVELLVFFVIPMKAKYLVILYGALEFMSLVSSGGGGNVSHVGHLGGIVFGLIFFLIMRRRGIEFKAKKIRAKINREMKATSAAPPSGKSDETAKLLVILQKVKNGGAEALSDDEYQHIRLKEIMMEGRTDICVEEDFDYTDEYCLKCDDVEVCLMREIKKYI